MSKRQEFTKRTKDEAWVRAQGFCEGEGCNVHFGSRDQVEFDHITPCALGGGRELTNCMVLCRACHKKKQKAIRAELRRQTAWAGRIRAGKKLHEIQSKADRSQSPPAKSPADRGPRPKTGNQLNLPIQGIEHMKFPVRVSLTKGPRLTVWVDDNYDKFSDRYSMRFLPPDDKSNAWRLALVRGSNGSVLRHRVEKTKTLYFPIDPIAFANNQTPGYFGMAQCEAEVRELGLVITLPVNLPKPIFRERRGKSEEETAPPKETSQDASPDRIRNAIAEVNRVVELTEGLELTLVSGRLGARRVTEETF